MNLNFPELLVEIEQIPKDWIPGLLKHMVTTAIDKGVFPEPDGVLKFVQRAEAEYRWAKKQDGGGDVLP